MPNKGDFRQKSLPHIITYGMGQIPRNPMDLQTFWSTISELADWMLDCPSTPMTVR